MELSEEEKIDLIEKLSDQEWRINNLYSIIDEKGNKIPYRPNLIQRRIMSERKDKKCVILKYRQGGVSTHFIILLVDDILWGGRNITNYFVTHRQDLLDEFFKKAKFTYDSLDPIYKSLLEKPKTDNSNELYFKGTNNTLKIGLDLRGRTPTKVHISEFAFNQEQKQKELYNAINQFRETEITIETTANGVGDTFYNLCSQAKNGEGEYQLLFFPWYIDDRNEIDYPVGFEINAEEELILQQHLVKYPREKALRKLYWRRTRISTSMALGDDGLKKFMQENPATIEESFITSGASVFDLSMAYQIQHPYHEIEGFKLYEHPTDQLSIGIDIAEGGVRGDYSAITARSPNGKTVFQFKEKCSEIILAKKLDFILNYIEDGKKYIGTIIPENNVGLAFINECKSYPWFYLVIREQKMNNANDYQADDIQKYGFRTTAQSKDLIIREFRSALYQKEIWITNDTYAEMRTFQYDKNNRPNASLPNHDDLLISDMIAYYGTKHIEYKVSGEVEQQIDYYGLTPIQKLHWRLKHPDEDPPDQDNIF